MMPASSHLVTNLSIIIEISSGNYNSVTLTPILTKLLFVLLGCKIIKADFRKSCEIDIQY